MIVGILNVNVSSKKHSRASKSAVRDIKAAIEEINEAIADLTRERDNLVAMLKEFDDEKED